MVGHEAHVLGFPSRQRTRAARAAHITTFPSVTSGVNPVSEAPPTVRAVVTISALNADGHAEHVSARVRGDGSFTLMLSKGRFRALVEADAIRLESVYRFAYRYLP